MSPAVPEPDVPFEELPPGSKPAIEPEFPGSGLSPEPRHTPAAGPAYPDSEDALLSACLIDDGITLSAARDAGLNPQSFTDPIRGAVFAQLQDLQARSLPVSIEVLYRELERSGALQAAGGLPNLLRITHISPTTAEAKYHISRLLDAQALRGILQAVNQTRDTIIGRNGTGEPPAEILADLTRRLDFAGANASDLRQRYLSRQFNPTNPPKETPARISIAGKPLCSPGNITNLIAQSKAGKSSFASGIIAAVMVADKQLEGRDTLGATALPPGSTKFIHIDTEQSPFDHDQLVRLCVRRAQIDVAPSWLWSFGLAGFNANELRTALTQILKSAKSTGGVYAILLDGAADFVNDVNDPGECNPFVAELHGIAIAHNCPLITVVHENPGQDFGKMRGHLGSQLERKAESNLRLKKTDECTVVFSEKMRKAPILENDGPRFRWSNKERMHVTCNTLIASRDEIKRRKLRDLADAVFEALGKTQARYAEFLRTIEEVRKVGHSYAEDRFADMKRLEVITKNPITQAWEIFVRRDDPE